MKEEEERTPLRTILQNFLNHIEKLDKEKLEGSYDKEFQELKLFSEFLKTSKQYSCFQGEKEVNKKKNRYKDILPFDCSRVILEDYAGIPGSDYINANYIKGASGSPAYIASQGPLPHTVNDFWRMVVQCEVQVIVMACNEEEAGKHKCENYWVEREGEEKQFGMVAIQLMKASVVCPDFLVRTMRLKYTKSHSSVQEERTVCQFHYSAWPDHGVPPLVRPLLDMVRLVRDTQASETLPVLVHCSAGCGRTGTICAIDYVWGLLRAGKLTRDFSLFKLVREMRKQRIAMVQTKEQYVLVHHAVKELFNEQLRMIDSHPYENIDVNGMVKESPEPLYATITPEIYSEEKQDTNEKEGVSTESEDAPPLPCKRKAYTAHTKQEKEVENRTQKHRSTTSEQASSSSSSSPGPSPNGSTASSSSLLHRPRIAKLRALFERTSNREGKNLQEKNRTHQQVTRSHSLGAVRKVEESGSFVQPIPNRGVLRVPQLSLTSDASFVRSGRPALPIKRSKSLKVLSSSERIKFSVLGMQSGMCSESHYNDVKKEDGSDKVCSTVSSSVSDKSVDEVKPVVPPKKVPRDKISEHKVPKILANSCRASNSQNVPPVVKKNENVSLSHQQSSSMNCWRRSLESLPLDSELSTSSSYQVTNEVPAKRQESYRLDDAAEKLFHDCKDYLSDRSQSDSSEPPVNMEMRYQDTTHIDTLQHLTVEVQRKLNTMVTGLGSRERRNSFRQAISKETGPNNRPRCYESSSNNTNSEIINLVRNHSDISGASEKTSTDTSQLKTKFVPKPNHNVTSQFQVSTRSGRSGKAFCLKMEHQSCSQYQKATLDTFSGSQVASKGPFLSQSECSAQNIYSNPKDVASFQGRRVPRVDGPRCSKSILQSSDNVNVKENVESCSTVMQNPRHLARVTVPLHPKMNNPCHPSSSRPAEVVGHGCVDRTASANIRSSVSSPNPAKISVSVAKRVASSSKGKVPISIPSSAKHEQTQPGKLEIAALGRTAYVESSSLHPLLVHSEASCTQLLMTTNKQNSITEDADVSIGLRLVDSHAIPSKVNSKREVGMKAESQGSQPFERLEVGAGAVRRVDAAQGGSRLASGEKPMNPHGGVPPKQEQGLWGLEGGIGNRSREVRAPALDKVERNLGPGVPNKGGRQKCEIQAVENPSYGNTGASSHKNVSRQELEAWIGAPGVDVDMVGASIKPSRDQGTSLTRALQAFNFRKSSRGLSVSPPQQRRAPPQQPQVFVKKQHYL